MTAQLTNEGIQVHEPTQAGTTEPTAAAGHGRLQGAWDRLRRGVQEMNYASRRVVELQAPWSVDEQWHRK
jgi:hypothetical protein